MEPNARPQGSTGASKWLIVGGVALAAVAIVGAVLVLLVLTGIIAEPETLLESAIRMLSGR